MKGLSHLVRHILIISQLIVREANSHVRLMLLRLANRYGRLPITAPGGPVVSLTTYGTRAQSVHLAVESIGRGNMKPSRLILWVDEAALFKNLPAGIYRLLKRGLEVKLCKNYGPHTKYYPYLESQDVFDLPLVTADDDVLYPRYWLKKLAKAFQQFPNVVNCHRAHLMVLNKDGIAKYMHWKSSYSTEPSFCRFATGVGGVIYPPPLQRVIKQAGTAFMQCCPKADDIWLNVQALRAGYKVRQIRKKGFRLVEIPGTQSIALRNHNWAGGENDHQIAATYHASDIARLRGHE